MLPDGSGVVRAVEIISRGTKQICTLNKLVPSNCSVDDAGKPPSSVVPSLTRTYETEQGVAGSIDRMMDTNRTIATKQG